MVVLHEGTQILRQVDGGLLDTREARGGDSTDQRDVIFVVHVMEDMQHLEAVQREREAQRV